MILSTKNRPSGGPPGHRQRSQAGGWQGWSRRLQPGPAGGERIPHPAAWRHTSLGLAASGGGPEVGSVVSIQFGQDHPSRASHRHPTAARATGRQQGQSTWLRTTRHGHSKKITNSLTTRSPTKIVRVVSSIAIVWPHRVRDEPSKTPLLVDYRWVLSFETVFKRCCFGVFALGGGVTLWKAWSLWPNEREITSVDHARSSHVAGGCGLSYVVYCNMFHKEAKLRWLLSVRLVGRLIANRHDSGLQSTEACPG